MIGRRQFLGLAAAGAMLGATGCAVCPGSFGAAARRNPAIIPAAAAAQSFVAEGAVAAPGSSGRYTIPELLSAPSFFIAHRGSGDNWPEHTMRAYSQSAAAGLKSIEVSVSATRDGVLVCHHDLTTERLTGVDLTIGQASYAAIESLRNDARPWLGPATALEPVPRLTDVLDRFAGSHVIFLEDKQGTNAERILDLLGGYPAAREHIVWKQPAESSAHSQAAADGYTTWGYLTSPDHDRIDALVPLVDLLGIHHTAPEDRIRELVDSGKPVIAWEVHRRSEYARLRELGVRGFICSNIRHVLHQEAPLARDRFAEGIRGTGDLPWQADGVWDGQPAFVDGAVRMAGPEHAGYSLGSMAEAVDATDWELEFELRWPEGLPTGTAGAGVSFGQDTDSPFRAGPGGAGVGYYLDFGADGRLVLYRQDSGSAAAVELAAAGSTPPAPREWVRFVAAVTPRSVAVRRTGGTPDAPAVLARDTRYGGLWFSLLKNYDGGPPVEFRRVRLRAVAARDSCQNVG